MPYDNLSVRTIASKKCLMSARIAYHGMNSIRVDIYLNIALPKIMRCDKRSNWWILHAEYGTT